jgi:hypothetical protein
MHVLRAFLRFWYDFIVGDDWIVAAGVVLALMVTALLTRARVPAWWLLPAVVVVLLTAAVARAARAGRTSTPDAAGPRHTP